MIIKRIIRVVPIVVLFVVVGIILNLTFVPRDETETMSLNVPAGVTLLDHNGTDVQEVSVDEFFDLDLENPIMYVTSRPGKATLIYLGVGKDSQGNSVVFQVQETLGFDGPGHRIKHSVNIDQETVTIDRNVDPFNWGFAYLVILAGVIIVAISMWRLIIDRVTGK